MAASHTTHPTSPVSDWYILTVLSSSKSELRGYRVSGSKLGPQQLPILIKLLANHLCSWSCFATHIWPSLGNVNELQARQLNTLLLTQSTQQVTGTATIYTTIVIVNYQVNLLSMNEVTQQWQGRRRESAVVFCLLRHTDAGVWCTTLSQACCYLLPR